MKTIALPKAKDDLSKFLRLAEKEEIVITRHGRGGLVGFATEDDWFEYRLEHDPRFLKRIASARRNLQEGEGVPIEDLEQREGTPMPEPDTKRDIDEVRWAPRVLPSLIRRL
jgi:PHD/YefM family antitoxin component YafN of YafNO toxin-antitoxin module